MDAIQIPTQFHLERLWGISDCLRGYGGRGSRSCAGAPAPNATRYAGYCDPGRRIGTKQPSRNPLAFTWRGTPIPRTCPARICHCTPRRAWVHRRQPRSLARSLADWHPPPGVQLTPRALFHLALARSDLLARSPEPRRLATGCGTGRTGVPQSIRSRERSALRSGHSGFSPTEFEISNDLLDRIF